MPARALTRSLRGTLCPLHRSYGTVRVELFLSDPLRQPCNINNEPTMRALPEDRRPQPHIMKIGLATKHKAWTQAGRSCYRPATAVYHLALDLLRRHPPILKTKRLAMSTPAIVNWYHALKTVHRGHVDGLHVVLELFNDIGDVFYANLCNAMAKRYNKTRENRSGEGWGERVKRKHLRIVCTDGDSLMPSCSVPRLGKKASSSSVMR